MVVRNCSGVDSLHNCATSELDVLWGDLDAVDMEIRSHQRGIRRCWVVLDECVAVSEKDHIEVEVPLRMMVKSQGGVSTIAIHFSTLEWSSSAILHSG